MLYCIIRISIICASEVKHVAEKSITISEAVLDRLFACGDGTAALLYLLICRDGAYRPASAARTLGCTRATLDAAAELLYRLDLIPKPSGPQPDESLPQYKQSERAARLRSDSEFRGVTSLAETVFARPLSENDLNNLLALRDYYGFSGDVICLLINHCAETNRLKNGSGRQLAMRAVLAEARFWSEHEITSYEEAERHIVRENEFRSELGQMTAALQIRGRALTKTEQSYVEKWINTGFGPEAAAIAYDRTVTATGRLVWKYMDAIFSDWQEKGLFTAEQIEAGDPRRQGKSGGNRSSAGAAAEETTDDKLARLARLNERMGNGEKHGNGN